MSTSQKAPLKASGRGPPDCGGLSDEAASRRTYAIIQPALKEGAWRLLVQDGGHAGWYYCTGRGAVSATNTCRMNACNIQTPHFVTSEPPSPAATATTPDTAMYWFTRSILLELLYSHVHACPPRAALERDESRRTRGSSS